MRGVLCACDQQRDPRVARLPPVTERAVDHGCPPELSDAGNVGDLVMHSRCQDDGAGGERRPVGERHGPASVHARDFPGKQMHRRQLCELHAASG